MKLSIITINRNKKDGLAATIKSAERQTFRDFEHVIIDGASTDGSAELAREYAAANPSFVKCVSEPDSGIYNAMNKGWKMASGEYTQFLNSGDTLAAPDSLARVFAAPRSADIVYGDVFFNYKKRLVELKAFPHYTPGAVCWYGLCHQSEFIRRELFIKYGGYDESFRLSGDCELAHRFAMKEVSYEYLGFSPSIYEGGGISEIMDDTSRAEVLAYLRKSLHPRMFLDYVHGMKLLAENRILREQMESERKIPRALWSNFVASIKWQIRARFGGKKEGEA